MEQILAYGILQNKYVEINEQAGLQAMGKSPSVGVAVSGVFILRMENLNSIFPLALPCLPWFQQMWLSELTKWAIYYKDSDLTIVFNKCEIKNVYMIPKFWHMPSGKVYLLPVGILKLVFNFHFRVYLEQCVLPIFGMPGFHMLIRPAICLRDLLLT